jgi:plastocyanin
MPAFHSRSLRNAAALMLAAGLGTALLFTPPQRAYAEQEIEATLSIKDHKFEPAELKVPAGKAIKLTVHNLDESAEEFESHDLQIEKVIAGKQSAIVRLKALDKGKYSFFGEYHEATAQGAVIAE